MFFFAVIVVLWASIRYGLYILVRSRLVCFFLLSVLVLLLFVVSGFNLITWAILVISFFNFHYCSNHFINYFIDYLSAFLVAGHFTTFLLLIHSHYFNYFNYFHHLRFFYFLSWLIYWHRCRYPLSISPIVLYTLRDFCISPPLSPSSSKNRSEARQFHLSCVW